MILLKNKLCKNKVWIIVLLVFLLLTLNVLINTTDKKAPDSDSQVVISGTVDKKEMLKTTKKIITSTDLILQGNYDKIPKNNISYNQTIETLQPMFSCDFEDKQHDKKINCGDLVVGEYGGVSPVFYELEQQGAIIKSNEKGKPVIDEENKSVMFKNDNAPHKLSPIKKSIESVKTNKQKREDLNVKSPYFNTWTFDIWVKPYRISNAQQNVFSKDDKFTLTFDDKGYNLLIKNNLGLIDTYNIPIDFSKELFNGLRQWQYIAVTYQNNILSFYKNGKIIKQQTIPDLKLTQDLNFHIGSATKFYPSMNFRGQVDKLNFFNKSLSAEDIKKIWTSGCQCNNLADNPYLYKN